MEENDNGFGPLGICHRLFNFIMSSFLTRGTKRIGLGTSNEALLHDHVVGADDNEMSVEFRHKNGSMVNRTNNTFGQVVAEENVKTTQPREKKGLKDLVEENGGQEKFKKKSTLTSGENENSTQTRLRKGLQDQGKGNGGREKVTKKKTVTYDQILVQENMNTTQARQKKDSEDQRNNNGDRKKPTTRSTLTIVDGGNLPGRKHHLLNVTSNINEKADEFIRSRKEAMEKALSTKQNTDV